jgi:hypothetical protein
VKGMCRRCWGLRSGCSWGISFTHIGASTLDELRKQPYHRSVTKLQCTSVRTSVTLYPPQGSEASRPASSPKLVCTSQLSRTVLHTYWGVCSPVRGLQLLGVALHKTIRLMGIAQPANTTERLLGVERPAKQQRPNDYWGSQGQQNEPK